MGSFFSSKSATVLGDLLQNNVLVDDSVICIGLSLAETERRPSSSYPSVDIVMMDAA